MVESIGKLREWASQHKGWSLFDIQINEIADEIEREIADLEAHIAATLGADDGTQWFELFGTPEKAARTVLGIVYSEAQGCDGDCPLTEFCNAHVDEEPPDDGGEFALLEWLRGKAVKR